MEQHGTSQARTHLSTQRIHAPAFWFLFDGGHLNVPITHNLFVCFGAQSFAKVFQRGNSSALRGQVRAKPHGGVSFVKGQRRQRTVRGIIRVGCAIETGHLNCYNIQ